jgi:hypothetical protein
MEATAISARVIGSLSNDEGMKGPHGLKSGLWSYSSFMVSASHRLQESLDTEGEDSGKVNSLPSRREILRDKRKKKRKPFLSG